MLNIYLSGPEEARTSGWSSMDRLRTPPPITSIGMLSKQKAHVGNDVPVSKGPVVSSLHFLHPF
jgi:casein kinase 1